MIRETNFSRILKTVNGDGFIDLVKRLYMEDFEKESHDKYFTQKNRYKHSIEKFVNLFGETKDIYIISVPGRTEIGGNHTDHNNGLVFSGAVNLDVLAIADKSNDNMVRVYSEEFKEKYELEIDELEKKSSETGSSVALIRGILKKLTEENFNIGGFNAYITSDIPVGSGLSSSAAFEVTVTEILNWLYNKGKIDKTTIAKISRYAENKYFEKPCGLMDQLTCCYGGLLQIDFKDIENPRITPINFDLSKTDYQLCLVNTGTSHANLTEEYASITKEMKKIANYFNASNCRELSFEKFINSIPKLRPLYGDRAILRVLHFFKENERVLKQVDCLRKGDFQGFFKQFKASENSSFKWLQNIYSCRDTSHQGISIALAIAENLFPDEAVARVHGGGFAGTIQIFLKKKIFKSLKDIYEKIFGKGSVIPIKLRDNGSVLVNDLLKK